MYEPIDLSSRVQILFANDFSVEVQAVKNLSFLFVHLVVI
jgi:hypothetical protein